MNPKINLQQILQGYDKRSTIFGSYYLISEACINRNKFKELSNSNFFNLMLQVLCFILEKSIKREYCFKSDIEDYIYELNNIFYNQSYSNEDIVELAGYIIKSLSNRGRVFEFETYKVDEENNGINGEVNIKLIDDNHVRLDDKDRLSYSLTNDGFKLLLQTKEYDDLLQIDVSQIIAKYRLERGDFAGAKNEILDIINILEIQHRKMENYIKMVKKDILHLNRESIVDVLSNSFETLSRQNEKYEELEKYTKELIESKEKLVDSNITNIDLTKVKQQLVLMKEVLEGIKLAQKTSSNLLSGIQNFRLEFDDILIKLLSVARLKKFNFEKEILEQVEKDITKLESVANLYKPLYLLKTPNLYNPSMAYASQNINRKVEESKKYLDISDYEVIENQEKIDNINKNQNYYKVFMKEFLVYGINNKEFDLKGFFNNFLVNDKNKYIEITSDANLLRQVLLLFVNTKEIKKSKILNDINKMTGVKQLEFQIELTCKDIFEEFNYIEEVFDGLEVENNREEITINTEIDLEEMLARKLTIPNLRIKFI